MSNPEEMQHKAKTGKGFSLHAEQPAFMLAPKMARAEAALTRAWARPSIQMARENPQERGRREREVKALL